MFRFFITIATLLTTGAHSLLGCGWHHDHGRRPAGCVGGETPEHKSVNENSCCDHLVCKSRLPEESEALAAINGPDACPCDRQNNDSAPAYPCQEGQCRYLVHAKVEPPSWEEPWQLFSEEILPLALPADLLRVGPSGIGTAHRPASLLFGPLCIRDLTQVALI